jgi:hypothetical protein
MKTSLLLIAASVAAPALAEPRMVFPPEIMSSDPPAPVGGELKTREPLGAMYRMLHLQEGGMDAVLLGGSIPKRPLLQLYQRLPPPR